MDTTQLKNYAPEARRNFIDAVTAQAARIGISRDHVSPAEVRGDVMLVDGQAFPATQAKARESLIARIEARGFDQTMEAIAYTWFNRFAAIRYMEVHGYLDHGYRVLSTTGTGSRPEILDHTGELDFPDLDQDRVVELKLDGTRDEELYRILLLAQCNALHRAMPFLFEQIGDETELLLPANLLHSDSLISQMVDAIDEESWQEIEIIGWLYQFYISEKKDQVIGKVVKSEDIPAATQLFTPNWIVKYMVQNSLGAQWLATYPRSPLKGQMAYYIEPAEQTDEVNAQLAATTPSQLNPEELTLVDPACGSGHILVEAYELFKAIYLERGYRQHDIPQLILEKNLFGLDIDERAAQLTGFALIMKGRADDRRLFERGVTLNVMVLVDSAGFDTEALAKGVKLSDHGLKPEDLTELKRLFEHATTFGSLIHVPEALAEKLPALKQLSEATSQDLFVSEAIKRLGPLVQQAELLSAQHDAVVANPPYMGSKYHAPALKGFLKDQYSDVKSDLFSAFAIRSSAFGQPNARVGLMSPNVWMYIAAHEKLREFVSSQASLASLVELPLSGFKGATVQICSFSFSNTRVPNVKASFIRLVDFKGGDPEMATFTRQAIERRDCSWLFAVAPDEFKKIPGRPVAYWLSTAAILAYAKGENLGSVCYGQPGLQTSNNDRFVRRWTEVSIARMGIGCTNSEEAQTSGRRWFPYLKGGDFRKWFGNQDHLVNWANDGSEIKEYVSAKYPYLKGNIDYVVKDRGYYFSRLISYTKITSGAFSARTAEPGFVFDVAGSSVFPDLAQYWLIAGFLCSKLATMYVRAQNPTLNIQSGDIDRLPLLMTELAPIEGAVNRIVMALVVLSRDDWNAYERSWDFQSLPLVTASCEPKPTLESSYAAWVTQNRATIAEMKRLEEENNRLFIDAYGLAGELTPDVPIEQITLTMNPAYRYGGKLTEEEQWIRLRQDTLGELVSYAIGCMMGRYSLDEPGLIYAHSGNEGFDPGRYPTFPADDDGIIPLTDTEWFDDDAANRITEFLSVAWDPAHLEANLDFLAADLSPKRNETSRDTIRRYLCDKFFKDHLQTYKKRPIYWLFTSGKQRAFQALVYLHRYHEGTLSRMRSEYVVPLQGKMAARIETLEGDIQAATSSAQSKRLEKERDKLQKQELELRKFEEKLRHYADMRISLDLDDGVKVNYGKFGDLLAEVKAVHGKKK